MAMEHPQIVSEGAPYKSLVGIVVTARVTARVTDVIVVMKNAMRKALQQTPDVWLRDFLAWIQRQVGNTGGESGRFWYAFINVSVAIWWNPSAKILAVFPSVYHFW